MKTNGFQLAAARPTGVRPNTQFTEAVMGRIVAKQPKRFVALFRRKPALALLIILATIALVSGTACAVGYLWPKLIPSITAPQQSSSGRSSVIVTNCDKVDTSKRYELKQGAPISVDKINDVVKAQCELTTVSDWASKTYMTLHPDTHPDNKPGSIRQYTTITPGAFAVQIAKIDKSALTIADSGSLLQRSITISPETKVVINGQYGALSQLKPDDVITYVAQETITLKNQASCTDKNCQADITASSEQILAVIKLTYSFDAYRAISSLSELPTCSGNPTDECPNTSSIDVYESLTDMPGTHWADITGKVVSYDDQSIVLTTTSGRQVVVYTPWNLISRFNASKSSGYGLTILAGDTLQVSYHQTDGVTGDAEVPWKQVTGVKLLIEINEKGGPVHKY